MTNYEKIINRIRAKCFSLFPLVEFLETSSNKSNVVFQINTLKLEVNNLLDEMKFTLMEKKGFY